MKNRKHKSDLIKLAESIEALADAIEKESAEETRQVKTAERRAAIDYGTVGDGYNGNGASDPITAFALS